MLKFIFIFAIISTTIFVVIDSSQVSYCNSVNVFKSVSRESDHKEVFNFTVDISFEVVDDFNTVVSFKNFSSWSLDSSTYYQIAPIQYESDFDSLNISCPSIVGDCSVIVSNSIEGNFFLPLSNESLYSERATFLKEFRIDSGIIFDSIYGSYFNSQSKRCYEYLFPNNKVCCTKFENLQIPDALPPKCIQFDGNTTFNTVQGNTVLGSLSTHFALTPLGVEYTISPTFLPNGSLYSFYSNQFKNALFLLKEAVTYFDYDSELPLNLYYLMDMEISNSSINTLGSTTVGKIIKRDEAILKDLTTPYSPDAPCSGSISPPFLGSTATNSFCCTKFEAVSSEQTCAEYESITKIYNSAFFKGTSFDVKYSFNNATAWTVKIVNFQSPSNSTLQVEAYSTDLFSQTCQVSTTSPQNSCTFKVSTTNQYALTFRTSDIRDGMQMSTISLSNNQIVIPSISPSKPCFQYYDFESNKVYDSLTEICCISKSGGAWPGAIQK